MIGVGGNCASKDVRCQHILQFAYVRNSSSMVNSRLDRAKLSEHFVTVISMAPTRLSQPEMPRYNSVLWDVLLSVVPSHQSPHLFPHFGLLSLSSSCSLHSLPFAVPPLFLLIPCLYSPLHFDAPLDHLTSNRKCPSACIFYLDLP